MGLGDGVFRAAAGERAQAEDELVLSAAAVCCFAPFLAPTALGGLEVAVLGRPVISPPPLTVAPAVFAPNVRESPTDAVNPPFVVAAAAALAASAAIAARGVRPGAADCAGAGAAVTCKGLVLGAGDCDDDTSRAASSCWSEAVGSCPSDSLAAAVLINFSTGARAMGLAAGWEAEEEKDGVVRFCRETGAVVEVDEEEAVAVAKSAAAFVSTTLPGAFETSSAMFPRAGKARSRAVGCAQGQLTPSQPWRLLPGWEGKSDSQFLMINFRILFYGTNRSTENILRIFSS